MTQTLAIVTNVPTPYRIAFFNTLEEELRREGARLAVGFAAEREPHRRWDLDLASQRYEWTILPGWHPAIAGAYPHLNPGVLRWLSRQRPTWMLCAGSWNMPTTVLASGYARARKVPCYFWSESHADSVRRRDGVIGAARLLALRAYSGFAVPNSRSREFLESLGLDGPFIPLPNAVDDAYFMEAQGMRDVAQLRAELGLPRDKLVLAVVARIEEEKGIHVLLQALRQLPPSTRETVTIAVAGSGQLEPALKAASGLPIHLLGQLPSDKIRHLLACADAFLLPSLRDPNPLSPIEAALAGLPLLLSSAVGNCAELVPSSAGGMIFASGSPSALRDTLEAFAKLAPKARAAMGEHATHNAQARFLSRPIARELIRHLRQVAP